MSIQHLTVSIVSHGQAALVKNLLSDLGRFASRGNLRVVLTLNVPEEPTWDSTTLPYPLTIVRNTIPKGYGANHNAAFRLSQGKYFSVLNPDIRLYENPFPILINFFDNPGVGLAAPVITDSSGQFEDNARRFPTPMVILAKALGLGRLRKNDYDIGQAVLYPDWVAGMFMVFSSIAFQRAKGFDERYFLYYEDVDLCARLRLMGYDIVMCPTVRAVHDARRQSHRSLRHLQWHLGSMLNFFVSRPYVKLMMRCGNGSKARQAADKPPAASGTNVNVRR